MKQTVCDRCGKVITSHSILGYNGRVTDVATGQYCKMFGPITKKYDLCYDCYEALKLFLRGEEANDT